MIISYNMP